MKKLVLIVATLLVLALVLGACNRATPVTGTEDKPTAEGSQSGEGQGGEAGQPVVVFHLGGGLRGADETWTIFPDGRVVSPSGAETTLTGEQLAGLLEVIEASKFTEIAGDYGKLSQCRDCYNYEVKVVQDGKTYTATTVDAAADAPQELWTVIDAIQGLVGNID